MINARAETIFEKPSFKNLILKKRCIIPADGFYEWKKDNSNKSKQPFYIHLKSGKPMGFAGIWDEWKSSEGKIVRSCTIITTTANELIQPMHNRMPVILEKDSYSRWLDKAIVGKEVLYMLNPFDECKMSLYPVTEKINMPSYNNEECIIALST